MLNLKYDCDQPVFYLGSALTGFAAIGVFLYKLYEKKLMSLQNMLLMLVIYAVIIYIISRIINWSCVKGYHKVAWVIALLPIISVLYMGLY